MPQSQKPTKIRRALAACKNCRKQKTRCDHKGGAPCHRCKVLGYAHLDKLLRLGWSVNLIMRIYINLRVLWAEDR